MSIPKNPIRQHYTYKIQEKEQPANVGYHGATNSRIRWTLHKGSARRGSMLPIHIAIREKGEEAFEFIFLEWHANKYMAELAEMQNIIRDQTFVRNGGYNLRGGGIDIEKRRKRELKRWHARKK